MRALSFSVGVCLGFATTTLGANNDGNPIPPDADIQRRIERVLHLALDRKVERRELVARMEEELGQIATKIPETLVRQVLHCHLRWANADPDRASEAMTIPFYFRLANTSIVRGVLPYVGSENRALDAAVNDLLRQVENGDSIARPPDYSEYETCISVSHKEPPLPLIRRMFDRSAGTALLTMSHVYTPFQDTARRRQLLWGEHVVSDTIWKHRHGFLPTTKVESEAATQIAKLSKDDAWWVRLYAAEIMRQHPAFRTPELVSRLKDDPDKLVRGAMDFARVKAKEAPKTPPAAVPPAPEPRPPVRK